MHIEINAHDTTVSGDTIEQFKALISDKFGRFEAHLTRIEAYLSDLNGADKHGIDKQCKLEARLTSQREPIIASAESGNMEQALHDATNKLMTSLGRHIDKLQDHHHKSKSLPVDVDPDSL